MDREALRRLVDEVPDSDIDRVASFVQRSKALAKKEHVSVLDVAEYILSKLGAMSAMKLQKLAYYAQAWSLVRDEGAMFPEEFQAWAGGPVCPELFKVHKGRYTVATVGGNPDLLDADARKTLDQVLDFYGDKTSQWLSDLTHDELPWQQARGGLPPGAKCTNVITTESMTAYYGSL